jgi:hypothetical protein
MAGRRNEENSAPSASVSNGRQQTIRRCSRLHKSTERVPKIRDARAAKEKSFKEKKLQQARRRVLKQRQHDGAVTVDRPDDTDEIRELRGVWHFYFRRNFSFPYHSQAALARAQRERNAAEAAVTRAFYRQGPPDRPLRVVEVRLDALVAFGLRTGSSFCFVNTSHPLRTFYY